MLSSSFCMKGMLVRGYGWRILFVSIVQHGSNFGVSCTPVPWRRNLEAVSISWGMLCVIRRLPGGLGRHIQGELEPPMVDLVALDLKRVVVVSLAHQESPLVNGFRGRDLLGLLGLPCWFWCCFAGYSQVLYWSLFQEKPTCKLRVLGHVTDILTAGGVDVGLAHLERDDISGEGR